MMKVKYYKCPICNSKYKTLTGWGDHMHRFHPDEIPEGYSDSRYFYYTKTGKRNGICRTCKKPTDWNENSQKYNQYCNNPACKQAYVKIAKQRMIDRYGKVHLLNDPDVQREMIQHRKISGTFRMSDGGKIGYTGKNEKKFLEMLDKMFEWPSADIMSPSPHTYYYDYHNEKDPDVQDDQKFYIPDMYIPSLNVEIEVEQTTSGNQKMMDVYVVKKKQKEEIMRKNPNVNYVKVSDNDFTPFFDFLLKMKEQDPSEERSMDVASESYLPALESTNPDLDVVKKIEECAKEHNITLKISKNGEWGLSQWEKGANQLFLVANCPNITSAVKTLKTCIDTDRYNLKMDNYHTIFLKRKKSAAMESSSNAVINKIDDLDIFTPKELSNWMRRHIKYREFSHLMTPQEVMDKKAGSCHDQVMFEKTMFSKMHIPHGELFFMEYNEGESVGGRTHTLLWYKDNKGKYYWFENSWGGHEGIHGPYSSIKDLKKDVIDRMLAESPYTKVYSTTVTGVRSGMSLNEYVQACQESYIGIDDAIAMESGYLFDTDYICINFEKLYQKKTNLIFITGLSGSGKSTYAERYIKMWDGKFDGKRMLHVELDHLGYILNDKDASLIEYYKECDPCLYSFLRKEKIDITKSHTNTEKGKFYRKYIKFILQWCSKNADKIFVIEGIQIYEEFAYGDVDITTFPMVLLGTSALKSALRAYKRNGEKGITEFTSLVKWLFRDEKILNQIRKKITSGKNWKYDGYKMVTYTNDSILESAVNSHSETDSSQVAIESYTDYFDKLTFLDISENKDQAVCLLKNKEPTYVKNIDWYNGELVLDGNKIIGQVFVGNGNAKDRGFITGIWVDKDYRRKGLGRRLVNDAITKYGGIDLTVNKNNHNAIQLYKECGFHMKRNIDPTKKDIYWMAINTPALEEANYSKENCYPVYIVLMHSGTLLANAIKKFTNDEFSHACISFNSNLTPLYSFGNKKVGGIDAGFTIQSPASEFFKVKQAKYKVYVMYVNHASYQKMQENMEYFLENRMTLKYALLDLLKVWRGKPSEDSKKFFCSRFVMAVIGGGRKLDKVASLYKPQDIAELEDISCVNAGNDFSKYDVRITEKNLKKVQKKQFSSIAFEELLNVCGISSLPEESIAIEGLFSFNKSGEITTADKIEQWKNILFRSHNLMGDTKGHAKVRLFGPFISIENGYVIIRGINYQLLKNRIKEYYKDNSINNIFNPIYDAMSFRRFKQKRIGRSEIKVDYLETPIFFALELSKLFTELGEWYNDRRYLSMAKLTYERTWLKETDQASAHVEMLNTSKLRDVLSVQLLPHQETFIQRYPVLKAQLNLKGYILAFEQGLGKTLTAVALAECLGMDHVYIVCPNTSEMKMVWKTEIKKYIKRYRDEDTFLSEVMICDDKTSLYNENRTKYFIINNESIPKMYPYITKGKNMLVVDESHNFRNLEGKRTKELFELQKQLNACDTLAMSGTPIKATPAELSPVLHLIDPTFTDTVASIYKRAFNVHHEIALSLVKSRFGRVMLRETKGILGTSLPPKTEKDLSLTMSGGTKYAVSTVMQLVNDKYAEIFAKGKKEALSLKGEFHTCLKKYMPSTYDRVRFDYLESQTAVSDSYPALHEVDIDFMNNAVRDTMSKITDRTEQKRFEFLVKNYLRYNGHCRGIAFGTIMPKYRNECFINLFDENKDILIRMIRESTTKTLIFSQFRNVAKHIHQTLLDEGIGAVLITGEVKNRLEIVDQFKESDVISVMVATPKTLGVGVTLTEASKVFFFGPPWRHSDYQQCSDRVHRIGQTQPVTIYNVVLDTGDELNLTGRMQDILNWSKRMVGDVVSTDVNKTEDDEFINEVLVANESSTDITTLQDFFDISEEAPTDSPIRLSQDILKNIIEYREGFRFMEAKAKYSIPEGVIIDEHAIQMPTNKEVAFKNAVWSKLGTAVFAQIADPESSANVRFLKVVTGGVPHWELITIKKIRKGSTLKYHPDSSDMTFSKDLE